MNGSIYPPEQVLAGVTGWDRQSFTTMEAKRIFFFFFFLKKKKKKKKKQRVLRSSGSSAGSQHLPDWRPGWFQTASEDQKAGATASDSSRNSALEAAVATAQEAIRVLLLGHGRWRQGLIARRS